MTAPDLSWIANLERATRIALAGALQNYLDTDKLQDYRGYPKQLEFHAAGTASRNRLIVAGNQTGKTFSAGAEAAMHLTGEYPSWWRGKRFDNPITLWAAGETGEATRDNAQRVLLGLPKQIGTGMIPKRLLSSMFGRARGVADLYDYYMVNHVSGGLSMLKFRHYSQDREAWQGPPVNVVWFDEEPPEPIYAEGLARTIAVQGITMMTFTPLKGYTPVVNLYLKDPHPEKSSRHTTRMTIFDALHIPRDKAEAEIARWPRHEQRARIYGEPALGEGLIYPYHEDELKVTPFAIPEHWPQLAGIDFGGTSMHAHPTAAVKIAHDSENDVVYIVKEYRKKSLKPPEHWLALRYWGETLKWAWPRDGLQEEKGSGGQLIEIYREEGMRAMPIHAQYKSAGRRGRRGQSANPFSSTLSVEKGIMDIQQRIENERMKVFATCPLFFQEMRQYHRERGKDGRLKIVKTMDDLMDATRYAIMMLRFAETPAPKRFRRRHQLDWQVGA